MALHYRVELSMRAHTELHSIQEYITQELYDIETANKQSDRILKAAETLAVFPKLYRVRRKDSKGRELRYMPVDNFMIIYTVDDSNNIVKVLHIVYSRRNIESMI